MKMLKSAILIFLSFLIFQIYTACGKDCKKKHTETIKAIAIGEISDMPKKWALHRKIIWKIVANQTLSK